MDRQERERYYGSDYDRGRYHDAGPVYRYERRAYPPRYRRVVRYDDCGPDGRYEYRVVRRYGRGGRYYESTYYEY
jgi:hypothetical protein